MKLARHISSRLIRALLHIDHFSGAVASSHLVIAYDQFHHDHMLEDQSSAGKICPEVDMTVRALVRTLSVET